jgi:hypothetical protein
MLSQTFGTVRGTGNWLKQHASVDGGCWLPIAVVAAYTAGDSSLF